MAINQPIGEEEDLKNITEENLYNLVENLHKEGFKEITREDIHCNLFDRCEDIYVDAEVIYPSEDLPSKFGVHRGYNGGGMHSSLIKTEFDRMADRRQAKAERVLNLFEKTFWKILKSADSLTENNTGEQLERWESLAI